MGGPAPSCEGDACAIPRTTYALEAARVEPSRGLYAPSGELPGGYTPAAWAALSESQQRTLLEREREERVRTLVAEGRTLADARATAERTLAADLARAGVTAITGLITSENQRARDDADRAQNLLLERERIARDVEIARLNNARDRAGAGERYSLVGSGAPGLEGAAAPDTTLRSVGLAVLVVGGVYLVTRKKGR